MMRTIIEESLRKSVSYPRYREHVSDLLAKGKSTGTNQSDALLHYSMLNDKRMHRLDKKMVLLAPTIAALKNTKKKRTWLLITEGWCGDAAQIAPVIHKMSLASENIELKVVLRDENEALMNQFLTNGSRSIPKLVVLNESGEVLSSWGPRPSIASKMVHDYKEQYGSLDDDFKRELQLWYTKNKGENIQKDLLSLID